MSYLIEPPHTTHRHTQVLLVMDVVESVRLMEQDQDNFVRRWQQLVQHAEQKILPLHGGRIVKSLGDGLMLAFASAPSCARAAFAILHFSQQAHAGWRPAQQMHLRMGGHLASFVTDHHDIYGTDVNLTARFCTLAGPDDMVISAEFRDQLVPALDADIEDLGECHLKHVTKPIHAYRIAPPGEAFAFPPLPISDKAWRPTVAVIPFTAHTAGPQEAALGDILAGEIIAALSRRTDLNVVSRLSGTDPWRREARLQRLQGRIKADYLLSGAYRVAGKLLVLVAELVEVRSGRVVWGESLKSTVQKIMQGEDQITAEVAVQLGKHMGWSNIPPATGSALPRRHAIIKRLCDQAFRVARAPEKS